MHKIYPCRLISSLSIFKGTASRVFSRRCGRLYQTMREIFDTAGVQSAKCHLSRRFLGSTRRPAEMTQKLSLTAPRFIAIFPNDLPLPRVHSLKKISDRALPLCHTLIPLKAQLHMKRKHEIPQTCCTYCVQCLNHHLASRPSIASIIALSSSSKAQSRVQQTRKLQPL
jgi:hypothetical protein